MQKDAQCMFCISAVFRGWIQQTEDSVKPYHNSIYQWSRQAGNRITINVTVKKMYNYWLKDKILETLRKKKETYPLTAKFNTIKNTDQ